jgi:hypothetical protein
LIAIRGFLHPATNILRQRLSNNALVSSGITFTAVVQARLQQGVDDALGEAVFHWA